MPRRRRRSSRRPAVAALIAAVLAAGAILARRRGALPPVPGQERLNAALARARGLAKSSAPGSEDYRCDCGQQYRATGLDRHRVYWVAGAEESDPVLGDECVECGRPLPA